MAKSSTNEYIPWLLRGDQELVSLQNADGTRQLKALAGVVCYAAQKLGVMDVSVQDYDLTHKTEDKSFVTINLIFLLRTN